MPSVTCVAATLICIPCASNTSSSKKHSWRKGCSIGNKIVEAITASNQTAGAEGEATLKALQNTYDLPPKPSSSNNKGSGKGTGDVKWATDGPAGVQTDPT